MDNAQKIWNRLISAGLTPAGAAGLMGNLYAESGLIPTNLQNTYEKKLGYTDAAYTAAVDKGAYASFADDRAGYGLAQWTYPSRKAALLAFARAKGASIGDLDMQLASCSRSCKACSAACGTSSAPPAASGKRLTRYCWISSGQPA